MKPKTFNYADYLNMKARAERAEAERDAAVEDIPHDCRTCATKPKNCLIDNPEPYMHKRANKCPAWQWKGGNQ